MSNQVLKIDRLDHLVLTVRDVEATCAFYKRVLHMKPVTYAGGRRALAFGNQRINLHPAESPISPHALNPTPGSADLCFITESSINDVVVHMQVVGVEVIMGPIRRTGANGPIISVYVRDPDNNLIEISEYDYYS